MHIDDSILLVQDDLAALIKEASDSSSFWAIPSPYLLARLTECVRLVMALVVVNFVNIVNIVKIANIVNIVMGQHNNFASPSVSVVSPFDNFVLYCHHYFIRNCQRNFCTFVVHLVTSLN